MDSTVSYARLKTALRQRNMLAVGGLILALGVTMQSYVLATRDTQIILTPTLLSDAAISSKAPSSEYMEQVTRDVANLFLNRHPHNLSYFRDNILRLAHPSAHGEIEAALMATERRLLATKSATVFYPSEIFVDPANLYSEIRGELQTYLGPERVSKEPKVFAVEWRYTSMRLQLEDFYAIDDEDAVAITAPLTTTQKAVQ